jgi:cytosine/adenosine deaminase-related metal-dependent hydrolase
MITIRGGTVVTMDPARRVARGDLRIDGGAIVDITDGKAPPSGEVVDAEGCIVLPGLVQAHTHLCQTLCRGRADDLTLLDWLRGRVWPYEAALDERAMRAAAELACAELLLGGTTAILDMGTVHETDVLIDAIGKSGLRACVGKAMMDVGDGVPTRLRDDTRRSLDESDALAKRWNGTFDGRMRYTYAPRFVLSCTDGLLREVGARVAAGAYVHTHASEQIPEIEVVRKERGEDNIVYLDSLGLVNERAALAHCVHATAAEQARLAQKGASVVHCPSSNLKLGSGVAPVPEMRKRGINVAIGADGAPCNNNLDAFVELRLAALLHKPRVGPLGMTALEALELATLGGARALGLAGQIGSIEVGRKADVIVVDPRRAHMTPVVDPVSTLVYAAQSRDVRHVLVDGRILVKDFALTSTTGLDLGRVIARGSEEAKRIQ